MDNPNRVREQKFTRELIEAGREVIASRDAAQVFGVHEATVRRLASDGKIHPRFILHFGKQPLYLLSDLTERYEARPEALAAARANAINCWVEGAGGWVLLCSRPGLSTWTEAVS